MKTVASIIAASLALAPAAVAAQAHDQVVEARIIVKTGQPTDARRSSHQSGERAAGQRERDRAQARAEQNRRQNRDQQTEKTSRTLKVGANGEIDLSNLSGDIIVTRGSGNTAQLEILETARGRTVEDARSALSIVTVDIVERGSRVEVKAVYPRHDTRSRERQNLNVSVQYTLTAPENTRISAQTLSGDIRTTDIKDFRWEKDGDRWVPRTVPLGEGMVDFGGYFRLVKELGVGGPISVHYEYPPLEGPNELPGLERRREAIALMRKDLELLRSMLRDAGL